MGQAEFDQEVPLAHRLAELAVRRAQGTFVIDGNPGAVAYLDGGNLVFAESPGVPDLGTRLVRSGRVPAQWWDEVTAGGGEPGPGVADLLITHQFITATELGDVLESITLDALLAVALPLADNAFRVRAAFRPDRPHWAGSVHHLDVSQAWEYVLREVRRVQQARSGVTPGTRPVLRDLSQASAVLTRWEWAIAGQASGDVTVDQLARQNGLSLHEASHWVGRLIRSGLCAAAGPPEQPARAAEHPPAAADGGHSSLPRRVPGALLPGKPAVPAAPPALPARVAAPPHGLEPSGHPDESVPQQFRSPDLPLLQQILHGLRSIR